MNTTPASTLIAPIDLSSPLNWSEMISKVCMINSIAGNQADMGWKAADHQLSKIVASEFKELTDAVAQRDIEKFRDGIADVLFTLIGLAHRTGLAQESVSVPVNTIFEHDLATVINSNLEKFDFTDEDADRTASKYGDMGIKTESLLDEATGAIVSRSVADQVDQKGNEYPAGKWLKSHRWSEPQFYPLPYCNSLVVEADSAVESVS